MSDTVAWSELLAAASAQIPDHEARRILEEATGADPSELPSVLERPATVQAVRRFEQMLARRRTGEPLQYVLGRWSFRSLDLMVDGRVLIPRPETEHVVSVALEELRRFEADHLPADAPLLVADLGTGSGAICLSVATEAPGALVFATDLSADALEVAQANVAGSGRVGARVRLLEGSWFGALEPLAAELRGRLGLVVTNPPYVAADEELPSEVADWEPAEALVAGPTGLEALAEIAGSAGDWLAPGASLVAEIAPHQADEAEQLLAACGLQPLGVLDDLTGRPRVAVARRA